MIPFVTMLARLAITNYALIEQLEFVPGEGLSIITGETGAGKSVMLGALNLLKGERADLKVIGDKNKKSIVEATFVSLDESVSSKILANDPDWDGNELILRREILPSGRSRAFINDSPVTLNQLEEVSGGLLDIHSQNSNSLLAQQQTQLHLLDAIAKNEVLLKEYTEEFNKYVALRLEIRRLKDEVQKNRAQSEIISFKLGQLDKLKPKAGELIKIEARYETLSNSEEIRESLIKARNALDGGESSGAMELIDDARAVLSDLDFTIWKDPDPEIQERLRQCAVEIKDIVETLEDVLGGLESDPQTLNSISARMQAYYAALRNFKVASDKELEDLHISLKKQFRDIQSEDGGTESLEREAKKIAATLKKLASEISVQRKKAATSLQQEIEEESRKLGLGNLKFEIALSDAKLSKTGGDNVEFRASFNKNGVMAPVGEIASGGEMARLMLAIKKSTSTRLSMPTIIFDEIDTGVSGHIADRMGEMMTQMGELMQIITITHLPQVAAKGERHFKVFKEDRGEKTVSDVMLLSESQREEEIGRMLSGVEIDNAARENARSLLGKKRK